MLRRLRGQEIERASTVVVLLYACNTCILLFRAVEERQRVDTGIAVTEEYGRHELTICDCRAIGSDNHRTLGVLIVVHVVIISPRIEIVGIACEHQSRSQ